MDIELLKTPFKPEDISWRIQRSGMRNGKPWAMVLAYVDARAIMDRLDEVVGPMLWSDKYEHLKDGVVCELSIDGVTKVDGAPETAVEAFKGGISKAFVRAAVKWGIGRYLYNLKENFANCSTTKKANWNYVKTKDGAFYWETPTLPAWALPRTAKAQVVVAKTTVNDLDKPALLELFKLSISKLTNGFSETDKVKVIYRELNVTGWKDLVALDLEILRELYEGLINNA